MIPACSPRSCKASSAGSRSRTVCVIGEPLSREGVMKRVRGTLASVFAAAAVVVGLCAGSASAADEAKTAEMLIKVLKAGRVVVSDHQELLNDANKGDKGFTP